MGSSYAVQAVPPDTPAFVTVDSHVSLIYLAQPPQYATQVEETHNGITETLLTDPAHIGTYIQMPLYTG